MLSPKKLKYSKQQKGSVKGYATSGNTLVYGQYAMYSVGRGYITARQIESMRVVISRSIKKGGKLYFRIFPDIPRTKKPSETRMGKGKGAVDFWTARIKPGRVIFEVSGISKDIAFKAFKVAASKISIPIKYLVRVS